MLLPVEQKAYNLSVTPQTLTALEVQDPKPARRKHGPDPNIRTAPCGLQQSALGVASSVWCTSGHCVINRNACQDAGHCGFEQTVKCAHERSVHLFIDSLLNKDKQSRAYMCKDNKAFVRGVCLDCRGNRCNTLGYDIKKVRTGRSKKLYLKTRSRMPFKLYHYQFRIQFINQIERTEPLLTISLTGTKEESGDVSIAVNDGISGNTTVTFLITLDRDLGELMMLKLSWEGSDLWKNVWNRMQNIFSWAGEGTNPHLTVGKISVKAGETQQRTSFCTMTNDGHVEMAEDKEFVRCKEDSPKLHKRHQQHRV